MTLEVGALTGSWVNTWSGATVSRLEIFGSEGLLVSAWAPDGEWGAAPGRAFAPSRVGVCAEGFSAEFELPGGGARLAANGGRGLLSVLIFRWDAAGTTYSREFFVREAE